MKLKALITLFIALNLSSCNFKQSKHPKTSQNELESKIEKWVFEYNLSGNTVYLDSSYAKLIEGKYFKTQSLNDKNIDLIYPIYFTTGRYDELLDLFETSEGIDTRNKIYLINLLNAYSSYKKGEKLEGDNFIRKNIEDKREIFDRDRRDSIVFMEFYLMEAYIKDRAEIYREIDSINAKSNLFSDMFIEEILKPQIDNQYSSMPKFVKDESS